MSIFRVEKNANYTVMSNYHLRDKNLSLKTIGLLSLILSLPEDWDYSQVGLAAICKDGEDSIRSGLKELEKYGYLERERERDENGHMRGVIYHIYEVPKHKTQNDCEPAIKKNNAGKDSCFKTLKNPEADLPKRENPMLVNPILESPTQESPVLGKESQIITNKQNTYQSRTDQSIHPSEDTSSTDKMDRSMNNNTYSTLLELIRENVNYDFFVFQKQRLEQKFENGEIQFDEYNFKCDIYDVHRVDQVIGYMLDIMTSISTDPIKIGDDLINRNMIKSKFGKIGFQEMQRVVRELNTNPNIRNPKKYAISMLYNS
jgi:hypothetical protein